MVKNSLILSLFLLFSLCLSACSQRTEPPAPYTLGEQEVSFSRRSLITVEKGDTVRSLAKKHKVSAKALVRLNSLKSPYKLYPGQRLMLPPQRVKKIKKTSKKEAPLKVQVLAPEKTKIIPKEKPGKKKPTPSKPEAKENLELKKETPPETNPEELEEALSEEQEVKSEASKEAPPKSIEKPQETLAQPQEGKSKKFVWPVKGSIIKPFELDKTKGLNNGINISASEGTPVVAAQEGEVAYTGTRIKGFGQLILIRHSGGWMTSYAHNQKILVKRGDKVTQGQTIALAGSTGNVSSPQVHFELIKKTQPVDPKPYLE